MMRPKFDTAKKGKVIKMKVTMRNKQLEVSIHSYGAEICSIRELETNTEYMWQADPKFWKRHAPVLFPFVGSLKDKKYTYQNQTYSMSQHGFARDMEFRIVEQKEDEVWFELTSNEKTLINYPFEFVLQIGYQLEERSVTVVYRVLNPANKKLLFSIGAHPAFQCNYDGEDTFYLRVNHTKKLFAYYIDQQLGVRLQQPEEVEFAYIDQEYAYLRLTRELFSKDALIIEHTDISEAALCYHDKTPFVNVSFDAPLFGIWSPANTGAPFVCIEPWYGRCDAVDSCDDLTKKEYVKVLEGKEEFTCHYEFHF